MQRLRRQWPFLRSVLQEANRFKRQGLLQHANADQINAVSELVLNLLKNNIPVTPPIMAQLRSFEKVLRDLGRRQHSVKKRRQWLLSRKDEGFFMPSPRVMSMCSTDPLTLPTWVRLLQDANRETETWKDECSYWKHKYHMLYREYRHILRATHCESCRDQEDGELCPDCNHPPGWKRCT